MTPTTDHPLDNAMWRALTTSQAHLAMGGALARRFRPEYAVFAAMPRLSAAGFAELASLVQQTAPGPWFDRTAELGRFLGFEADGRLVAMVGERLRVPGHTEISAVCCHPGWRGKGLTADLMRLVSQAMVERGEPPFLHVLAENAPAIALYERLGFRKRIESRLTILRRSERTV